MKPKYRTWEDINNLSPWHSRCGRHSTVTGKGCSLPQGHGGKHDFSVDDRSDAQKKLDAMRGVK